VRGGGRRRLPGRESRASRRGFLAGVAGAGAATLAIPWISAAGAATDDDLAFANFGVSAELLLADFYSRALAARAVGASETLVLRRGRAAAGAHARALAALLVGAGDTAPEADDFEFAWPRKAFAAAAAIVTTGHAVLRPLCGAYQTAAASASVADYRVLFASLSASLGQQIGALALLAGPGGAEPFPVARDLEAASDALERHLG
jgi:hypothetical protein